MIYILGSGGHAKVIIDILLQKYKIDDLVLLDDNDAILGTIVCGIKISGKIADLPANFSEPAIIAIGSNCIRKKIAQKFTNANWITVIHNSAIVSPNASIGNGTVIMASAVLQNSSRCGQHVIINTASSIDHDDSIEDFCHIAPGCHLAGKVYVGEQSFIGVGTNVIQGICIGKNTIVGAGSCVIKDIPDNVVAVGTPAKIIKQNITI